MKNSIKNHNYRRLIFCLPTAFTATAAMAGVSFEKYKKNNPLTPIVNIPRNANLKIGKKLGEGGYGVVYEATARDSQGKMQEIIVKKPRKQTKKILKPEAQAGDALVEFYKKTGPFSLISDLQGLTSIPIPRMLNGGILIQKRISGMNFYRAMQSNDPSQSPFANDFVDDPQGELQRICGGLLIALNGLHQAGKVHCDIKPDNLMVEKHSGNFRFHLIDLGLVEDIGETAYLEFFSAGEVGKRRLNLAPECVSPRTEEERRISEIVLPSRDIYALGGLLWCLFFGRTGYDFAEKYFFEVSKEAPSLFVQWCRKIEGKYGKETLKKVAADWIGKKFQEMNRAMWDQRKKFYPEPVLEELAQITASCLSLYPQERPSAEDILLKLQNLAFSDWSNGNYKIQIDPRFNSEKAINASANDYDLHFGPCRWGMFSNEFLRKFRIGSLSVYDGHSHPLPTVPFEVKMDQYGDSWEEKISSAIGDCFTERFGKVYRTQGEECGSSLEQKLQNIAAASRKRIVVLIVGDGKFFKADFFEKLIIACPSKMEIVEGGWLWDDAVQKRLRAGDMEKGFSSRKNLFFICHKGLNRLLHYRPCFYAK
ncbi:MAG: serine/threonine-protein kinase [Puniceicoccales bacterium]|jgi:serine/threonine protein kinase|nr:serine/threonine-protein kinase [Puniceicoccales bacterium]